MRSGHYGSRVCPGYGGAVEPETPHVHEETGPRGEAGPGRTATTPRFGATCGACSCTPGITAPGAEAGGGGGRGGGLDKARSQGRAGGTGVPQGGRDTGRHEGPEHTVTAPPTHPPLCHFCPFLWPCRHSCPRGGRSPSGAPGKSPQIPLGLSFLISKRVLKSQSSNREGLRGRGFQNCKVCLHTEHTCVPVQTHASTLASPPAYTGRCTDTSEFLHTALGALHAHLSHAPVSAGVASIGINRRDTHTPIIRR